MTQQVKDTFIYNGKKLAIDQYLLEDYFNEFPDQRPTSEVFFTALWRKYIVTSEIANGQLVVKSIKVLSSNEEIELEDWKGDFPLNKKFDWFSGLIRIDENRLTDWKEEGEYFEYLEVYKGDLKRVISLSKDEIKTFREEQFDCFKTTETYKIVFAEWQQTNSKWNSEKVDHLIKDLLLKRYSRAVVEVAYSSRI